MCGIAGYYTFPGARVPSRELVLSMLDEIEYRGMDATGCAWRKRAGDARIETYKRAVTASRFVRTAQFRAMLKSRPQVLLMHTRQATHGKPEIDANNHPIIHKAGPVLIHNGVVYGADVNRTAADGTVDSFKIAERLAHQWTPEIVGDLSGYAAIAALDFRHPGEMILARDSAPLVLCERDGVLYFGSVLPSALMYSARGLWSAITMPDKTAVIIGEAGLSRKVTFSLQPIFQTRETERDKKISLGSMTGGKRTAKENRQRWRARYVETNGNKADVIGPVASTWQQELDALTGRDMLPGWSEYLPPGIGERFKLVDE